MRLTGQGDLCASLSFYKKVEPEHWIENVLNLVRLFTRAKLNVIRGALPKVTEKGERPVVLKKGLFVWTQIADVRVIYPFYYIWYVLEANGNLSLSYLPFPEKTHRNTVRMEQKY